MMNDRADGTAFLLPLVGVLVIVDKDPVKEDRQG